MKIHDLEPILRAHPFLQGLAEKHLDLMVGCASNVKYEKGEMIFHLGEEANRFLFIRAGRVSVEVEVPGRGPVEIQTLAEGDVLGWSWLFPPYQWNFDSRVLEATRAIALDGKCLRRKCEEDHDLGYELMKRFAAVMIGRLQATRLQLIDMYRAPAPD